jgi:hypothetical protein
MKPLLQSLSLKTLSGVCLASLLTLFSATPATANGPVGDHVNDLQANLGTYTQEVNWLIEQVDGIVDTYEKKGQKAAGADAVVHHWESVKFHAAIETNYVPIYAMIWQGLFGVKEAIDKKAPIDEVRQQQAMLEQTLWQALGAVKLAAQYQQRGLLPTVQTTGEGPTSPTETLDEIKQRLDRVVAKYAEKLPEEAVNIVHDTYLNRFEGVEGALIEQDAALVEDLEKDFNVTLPKALQGKASVADVRNIVMAMQGKLDRAKALLVEAEKSRKSVF